MKKFYKSIALAILAAAILLTQTRCQKENTDNSPNGPTVEQLEDDHPGLSIDCEDGKIVAEPAEDDDGNTNLQQEADDLSGQDCDPSDEEENNNTNNGTSSSIRKHARRSPIPPHHPNGSTNIVVDHPQPNIFSQALEPANAAATSFQIQDEFPNLLPIPFTPTFTSAALANYNQPCTPGVSIFMANWANMTVTRYATCPLAVMTRITMPSNPVQVRITPDGSTAVVTTIGNAIILINTANNTTTTIPTPLYNPYGLDISPDGTKAYVTSYSTAHAVVFQVNLTTRQLTTLAVQVNSFPKAIFLTPDGSAAWVNFNQSSSIYVIDTLSMTVSGTINAGGTADTGMAFTPDGTKAYVSVYGGSVSVFNTATLGLIASIPVADQPTDIYVSKEGSRAYVNSFATNSPVRTIISTAANKVIGTIPQTGPAMGLAIFH